MLLRIAGIIFPVLAVAGMGWLYARWKQPDLTVTNELNMAVLSPALVFWALGQQTSYFYMPGDLVERPVAPGERIRLGGLGHVPDEQQLTCALLF